MANTDYVGANGSIAWTTLVGGTNAPKEARCTVVQSNVYRPRFVTTRPGSLMQRLALGEFRGEITIRVQVTDDGTPPVPSTTVGLLTLGFGPNPTPTETHAYKVVVLSVRTGYNSLSGEDQHADYTCAISGTATTDTVTVVGGGSG